MTIKKINKNIYNENFINEKFYDKIESDYYYDNTIIIKDLYYIFNIFINYFNKIKIIILLFIIFIFIQKLI